jgi:hypothetical protein
MWNDVDGDGAVDQELVGNAKEGVIVPGDEKRMVRFNGVLDSIDKGLLWLSVVVDVFTRKDKSDVVVICFVIFMEGISAVNKFTQAVGYDGVIVEEIGHGRYTRGNLAMSGLDSDCLDKRQTD